MSRYTKVRQLYKDPLISTFLVEDRLHHGRFFDLKVFKSSIHHNTDISTNSSNNNNLVDYNIIQKSAYSDISNSNNTKIDFLDLLSKLTELRHPFCTQYYEVSVQSGVIHVISEHAHPGRFDLLIDECLRSNEQIDEILVLRWIAQLCIGLIYLENNSIHLVKLPISGTGLFNGGSDAKLVDIELHSIIDADISNSLANRTTKYHRQRQVLIRHLGIIAFELLTLRKFNSKYPCSPDPNARLSKKYRDFIRRMIFCQGYSDTESGDHVRPFTCYEEVLLASGIHRIVRQLFSETPGLSRLHPELSQFIMSKTIPRWKGTSHYTGINDLKRTTNTSDDIEILGDPGYERTSPVIEIHTHHPSSSSPSVSPKFKDQHTSDRKITVVHLPNNTTHSDYVYNRKQIDFDVGHHNQKNGGMANPNQNHGAHENYNGAQYNGKQNRGPDFCCQSDRWCPKYHPSCLSYKSNSPTASIDGQLHGACDPRRSAFPSLPYHNDHYYDPVLPNSISDINRLSQGHNHKTIHHYRSPSDLTNCNPTNNDVSQLSRRLNPSGHWAPPYAQDITTLPAQPCPRATPLLHPTSFVSLENSQAFRISKQNGPKEFMQIDMNQQPSSMNWKHSQQPKNQGVSPVESFSIVVKSPSVSLRMTTTSPTRLENPMPAAIEQQSLGCNKKWTRSLEDCLLRQVTSQKNENKGGCQRNRSQPRCRPAVDRPTVSSRIRREEISREYGVKRERSMGRKKQPLDISSIGIDMEESKHPCQKVTQQKVKLLFDTDINRRTNSKSYEEKVDQITFADSSGFSIDSNDNSTNSDEKDSRSAFQSILQRKQLSVKQSNNVRGRSLPAVPIHVQTLTLSEPMEHGSQKKIPKTRQSPDNSPPKIAFKNTRFAKRRHVSFSKLPSNDISTQKNSSTSISIGSDSVKLENAAISITNPSVHLVMSNIQENDTMIYGKESVSSTNDVNSPIMTQNNLNVNKTFIMESPQATSGSQITTAPGTPEKEMVVKMKINENNHHMLNRNCSTFGPRIFDGNQINLEYNEASYNGAVSINGTSSICSTTNNMDLLDDLFAAPN